MKETFYYELDGEKRSYTVKNDVPMSELLAAIQTAVEMCYFEDGTFHPELIEFAKEYVILDTLTDIEMPADSNGAYRYVRAIDGVPSVDADFIADGIYAAVRYENRMTVAAMQSHGLNRVADELHDVLNKFSALLDAGMALVNKASASMEGIDAAQLDSLATMLKKMDTDPARFAQGVLAHQEAQKKPAAKKRAAKKAN